MKALGELLSIYHSLPSYDTASEGQLEGWIKEAVLRMILRCCLKDQDPDPALLTLSKVFPLLR